MIPNRKYATFLMRLFAYIIDNLIFIPVYFALDKVSNINLFVIALSTAYYVWMTGTYGATIGKMVAKIKVVKENGEKLSYSDALVREIASYLSAVILFIGFLNVLWDSKKQAWHDKLAHTIVIQNA